MSWLLLLGAWPWLGGATALNYGLWHSGNGNGSRVLVLSPVISPSLCFQRLCSDWTTISPVTGDSQFQTFLAGMWLSRPPVIRPPRSLNGSPQPACDIDLSETLFQQFHTNIRRMCHSERWRFRVKVLFHPARGSHQ